MYSNKNIIESDPRQFNVGGTIHLTNYSSVTKKILNPYNTESKFYSPHYLLTARIRKWQTIVYGRKCYNSSILF